MDTVVQPQLTFAEHQHKKTTSSVFKAIMTSRNHHRDQSTVLQPLEMNNEGFDPGTDVSLGKGAMLPPKQPYVRQQSRDQSRNRENIKLSPVKPVAVFEDMSQASGFHKRTKSSVSLKSLMGNEKSSTSKIKSPKKEEGDKPKKSKSSTGLSNLLSRPKSSKDLRSETSRQQKDKENRTPPTSADIAAPPIWAQFANQPRQLSSVAKELPEHKSRDVDEEMARYTPLEYSPTKQRNFNDSQNPTLARRGEPKPRPKSAFLPSGISTTAFAETLSGLRKQTHARSGSDSSNQSEQYRPGAGARKTSETQNSSHGERTENRKVSDDSSKSALTMANRGPRVMAVVAAFNGKSKEPAKELVETKLDVKAIENAFECLLDSRNVPQNTRDKMRALDTNIKADFIRQDASGSESRSNTEGLLSNDSDGRVPQRPVAGRRLKTEESVVAAKEEPEISEAANGSKKPRPRSRTFTLSKGDSSPSKKPKSDRPVSRGRPKSGDLAPSASAKSLTSIGTAQALALLGKAPKPAVPDEFISYLRKVQKPESVEAGKLQKLRQLLRNETVSWVDAFITRGGMTEIVGLLDRIIHIEWREEHEDTLLHETLLCMKALCTTTLALQELSTIQSSLFPTLLAMLFGEDKKGPSEFITRNIIISLLFTYLSASTSMDMPARARILLSYLRDPTQPEAAQPPGFISSMHHPRPYRIWCKEIVNVTKEVFWIFLHHLNIIPFPSVNRESSSYTTNHFPRDRPPVPAAPYVGGVEWEATNYLASHLDLLNGILAALPSREERNSLRQELKDSGFEKCMGGSLRTCKEKFYGSVHAALSTWIGAAREDGWDEAFVREGPQREELVTRPSPKKGKRDEAPPKLEMLELETPKLDVGVKKQVSGWDDGGWL